MKTDDESFRWVAALLTLLRQHDGCQNIIWFADDEEPGAILRVIGGEPAAALQADAWPSALAGVVPSVATGMAAEHAEDFIARQTARGLGRDDKSAGQALPGERCL